MAATSQHFIAIVDDEECVRRALVISLGTGVS
jgi:hypothetical protein